MAKIKPQPLHDADEEALAQAFKTYDNEYEGLNWSLEELIEGKAKPDDELLDGAVSNMDGDPDIEDDDFDSDAIIKRLRPFNLEERKRILNRAFQLTS